MPAPTTTTTTNTDASKGRRFGWRHAAVAGIIANIASALPAGYSGDETSYQRLKTPPGSPPSWVFAPAWAIDNVHALEQPSNGAPALRYSRSTQRPRFRGTTWLLFAAFSALHFGFRSPILGALDTVAGPATMTHGTIKTARLDRRDRARTDERAGDAWG